MPYIIRPAYISGPPTEKQRTHPRFAEEPVIGAFHVRRGSFVRLDDGQYAASKHQIDTLLEAEAITVEREGEPVPTPKAKVAAPPPPPPVVAPDPEPVVAKLQVSDEVAVTDAVVTETQVAETQDIPLEVPVTRYQKKGKR